MYIIEAVPEFKIDLDEALQKLCSVKGKPPPPLTFYCMIILHFGQLNRWQHESKHSPPPPPFHQSKFILKLR